MPFCGMIHAVFKGQTHSGKAKKMKKIRHLHSNVAYMAALVLALCLSIPLSALAFRNPAQDPQNAIQSLEPSTIDRNTTPALDTSEAATRDTDGKSGSGGYVSAVLDAGEISLTSAEGAALSAACGFDTFNENHQNRWQATFSAATGTVRRLYGAASEAYGGTPEQGAREFLKSANTLFGLQANLEGLTTQNVSRSPRQQHVRFQQTLNGVAVQGAQIIVHSDPQGCVTMVQNTYRAGIVPVNRDMLAEETAREIARIDLQAQLGAQAELANPAAQKLLAPGNGYYRYIWRISTPTQGPAGLWVYHVDAETGTILYRGNELLYITKGKAKGYLDNEDYWLNRLKKFKIDYLFENKDGYLEGLLRGQHASIYDYNDDIVYEPSLNFIYDPVTDKPYFDQGQAYYQKNAVWEWWQKYVIRKYGPANIENFKTLSIPVIVNADIVDEALFCNAYYSPAAYDDPALGWLPGFVYGNENTCGFFNEDFVVDADIVRHEYAHAIMDWAGFDDQFGGEINGYGRAMGEGNSDWYAFLASGKPIIGYVTFAPDGLRNLDNNRRYPDDVDCPDLLSDNETLNDDNETACPDADPETDGYQGTPLPEEHYTGEIWGGYLYDLSRVLKKKALDFVYPSSFYFETADGHRDGYPDFLDAIRAQRDAELAMTGKNKQYYKAFGSMVSRGFIRALPDSAIYSHPCDYFGTAMPGEDTRDYLLLASPLNLRTEANMLNSGDEHEYPLYASAGMLVAASVKAKKGGLRAPLIELYSIDGTLLNSVDFSGDISVTKAVMSYTVTESGIYVVRVSGMNASPARGYYKMKLTAK